MAQPLPIIQSIPHAGLERPQLLRELLLLDDTGIYNECDLWVDQIYDFSALTSEAGSGTLATVTAPIARGIVDTNRPPYDLEDPDGPVKAQSSYGADVWARPLSHAEAGRLIDAYWAPYQTELARTLAEHREETLLLLDCHSMAQRGPTTYAFAGEARPLVCLANLGDRNGDPLVGGEPVSCPPGLLRTAALLVERHFGDLDLLEKDGEKPPVVAMNWPFAGGYILRRYSAPCVATAPPLDPASRAPFGIMVEINRGLYVGNQNGSTSPAPPNQERIDDLRRRMWSWAVELSAILGHHPGA